MTPLQRRATLAGSIAMVIAVVLVVPWRQKKPDPAEVSAGTSATAAPAIVENPDVAPAPAAGMDPPSTASPDLPMTTPVDAAAAPLPDRKPGLSFRPDTQSFYPPESRSLGEEGTSRLRLCFDDLGRVTEVTLAASSGSERLDAAAVQMGWHYRFTTTVVDGAPVQHQCMLQPVRFTLRAGQ
jgi:protein TonB